MKKVKITLLSLALFQGVCVAQDNLQSGYIVKDNNDTIRGWLDYRNWSEPPAEIFFTEKLGGPTDAFRPLSIKAFGIKDDHYESGVIDREMSPFTSETLDSKQAFDIRKDTVFLQLLVQGDKNLWMFKEQITPPQFFIWNNGRHELLLYKSFAVEKDGVREVFENNTFRNQLIQYLGDCRKLTGKINGLRYLKKSLVEIIEEYHDCQKKEIEFLRKERTKHHFGVLLGGAYSTVNFSSTLPFFQDPYFYLSVAEFNSTLNPAGGLYWEMVFPQNLGRWSLYSEFLFASFKTTGIYQDYNSPEDYEIYTIDLSFLRRRVNIMGRYNHHIKGGRFFFMAGVAPGSLKANENLLTIESKYYAPVEYTTGEAIANLKAREMGLIGGVGLEKGRFSVIARYERTNGLSSDPYMESAMKSYYLLIGFRF